MGLPTSPEHISKPPDKQSLSYVYDLSKFHADLPVPLSSREKRPEADSIHIDVDCNMGYVGIACDFAWILCVPSWMDLCLVNCIQLCDDSNASIAPQKTPDGLHSVCAYHCVLASVVSYTYFH